MKIEDGELLQQTIDKYKQELEVFKCFHCDEDAPGIVTTKRWIAWLEELKERRQQERELESCDWCQGRAGDLVYGKNRAIMADIDAETGELTVYLDGEEVASRKVNYCPMCGRPIGSAEEHDEPEYSPEGAQAYVS